MSNQIISRSEFEMFHICRQYWDDNGGRVDRRPYWDEIGTEQTGKRQRVYINTLWFSDWGSFSVAADRALTAAVVQYDAYHDRYVQSGTSYPLDENPHFLLEPQSWPNNGSYSIWVNCLCPNREQFEATLAEARQKIEDLQNGSFRPGTRVASTLGISFSAPLYPTQWCQDEVGTVGASFR